MSQTILAPFQLLELNVISAQDLAPISRSMRTYAIAWVHPDRKLSTRVDTHGHNNPTWNDKFVFRVDEDFLHEDTSAVMIEIYALHWFKDVHVGTVRVLVGNLVPTPTRPYQHHPQLGMRFVALQVRRPSGRPQGILNIGVALLHSSMRSMPLYSQLSTSAVGYKTLMGEDDPPRSQKHHAGSQTTTYSKPDLRRSKSDTSSMFGSEVRAKEFKNKGKTGKASSLVNGTEVSGKKLNNGRSSNSKAMSLISGSDIINRKKKDKKGKPSSVLSTSDWSVKRGKASSILSASDAISSVAPPKSWNDKKGKPISVLSASEVTVRDPSKKSSTIHPKPAGSSLSSSEEDPPKKISTSHKPSPKVNLVDSYTSTPGRRSALRTPKSPFKKTQSPYDPYVTPRKSNLMPVPFITESELGPSPSEVAAAIVKERVDQDNESSVVIGAWNEDDSVEGLQSKLERWRTELPPVYDRGEFSSFKSSEPRHERRHSEGSNGLFSCFSNICGIECSIVCGSGDQEKARKKNGSKNDRVPRSPSVGNLSYI